MKNLMTFLMVLLFISCNKDNETGTGTLINNFEANWREAETEEFLPIGKVIVKNGTSGCGEYRLRKNITNENEYLIACTSDGINWKKYILDIRTESINPFSKETSNPE